MPYYYTDPDRENDKWALPDVEVFMSRYWFWDDEHGETCLALNAEDVPRDENGEETVPIYDYGNGWFFAFGFPGCLWDSEPFGPYETESEALDAAREQ